MGEVLIYRSPVIHPGDIQLVNAISMDNLKAKLDKLLPKNTAKDAS
jgi:hypothetical protein